MIKHKKITGVATPLTKTLGGTEWDDIHVVETTLGFRASHEAEEDALINREGPDQLVMSRGTNPQTFRIYNTWSTGPNYERLSLGWSANVLSIASQNTGSGVSRPINFTVGGNTSFGIANTGPRLLNRIELTSSIGSGGDVFLTRENADQLGMFRGTNPQTFRVYNTRTDGSNYERAQIRWDANVLLIGTSNTGSGVTRPMTFETGGTPRWTVGTEGHFRPIANVTYDIANSTHQVRDVFVGRNANVANTIVVPSIGTSTANPFSLRSNNVTRLQLSAAGQLNVTCNYMPTTNAAFDIGNTTMMLRTAYANTVQTVNGLVLPVGADKWAS